VVNLVHLPNRAENTRIFLFLESDIPGVVQDAIDKPSGGAGTLRGDNPFRAYVHDLHDIDFNDNYADIRYSSCRKSSLSPYTNLALSAGQRIEEDLARKWIEPSNSTWSSSAMIVPKPNGGLHFNVE
jgi:hypothetical protein